MTINNDIILAYFNEVRYLHVITNELISNMNHSNDNLQRVILEYLTSIRGRNTNSTSPFRTSQNRFSTRNNSWSFPRSNTFSNNIFSTSRQNARPTPPPPRFAPPPPPPPMSITRQNEENGDVVFTGVVDLTPVPIYPSLRQIMNATEIKTFGEIEDPINTTCPITQEVFTSTDRVCQIKHCKHIFKDMCLYNWFLEHVDCPVCRFDIREDRNNTNTPNEDYTVSASRELPPEIINSFTRMVNQSLLGVGPIMDISATDV